ncbi:MAG: dihydropteroate synthase [Planctomycetes bacterium]|nr:dihydropteroate synthase [Planctomycetota bacterium]
MGVLNLTPDSFSDGGRFRSPDDAVAAGVALVDDGAELLDVGAVSTRPGAAPVSPADEWERLAPVLAGLRARVGVPLSLDTTSAEVLERALTVGVDLLNDVSALHDDARMATLAASAHIPVVLMHRRGTPATMQRDPHYDDAPGEVLAELLAAVREAEAAGIRPEDVLLDPGIGFGKRLQDNLDLLAELPRLVATGRRVVLGCSRKSFLGALTGRSVDEREHATTATTVLAALAGVAFVRVHDVRAARDALAVVAAVRARRS